LVHDESSAVSHAAPTLAKPAPELQPNQEHGRSWDEVLAAMPSVMVEGEADIEIAAATAIPAEDEAEDEEAAAGAAAGDARKAASAGASAVGAAAAAELAPRRRQAEIAAALAEADLGWFRCEI